MNALFKLVVQRGGQGDFREMNGVLVEPHCSSEIAWKLFIQLEWLTQSCVFISKNGFSCQAGSSRHDPIPRLPTWGCVSALGVPHSMDRLQLQGHQGSGSGLWHGCMWAQSVSSGSINSKRKLWKQNTFKKPDCIGLWIFYNFYHIYIFAPNVWKAPSLKCYWQ